MKTHRKFYKNQAHVEPTARAYFLHVKNSIQNAYTELHGARIQTLFGSLKIIKCLILDSVRLRLSENKNTHFNCVLSEVHIIYPCGFSYRVRSYTANISKNILLDY